MRSPVTKEKLALFFEELGNAARGPGKIYLVGGATALLLDIREQTIDIDIKLEPEPTGVFDSIAAIKEKLSISIELASPDDFMPPLPGWQERSQFIMRSGPIDFYHYDFYGQAMAKILRGHQIDLIDARSYIEQGKVKPVLLRDLFGEIKSNLSRYPAINPNEFESRLNEFLKEVGD